MDSFKQGTRSCVPPLLLALDVGTFKPSKEACRGTNMAPKFINCSSAPRCCCAWGSKVQCGAMCAHMCKRHKNVELEFGPVIDDNMVNNVVAFCRQSRHLGLSPLSIVTPDLLTADASIWAQTTVMVYQNHVVPP